VPRVNGSPIIIPTSADVHAAAERLKGKVRQTPVLRIPAIDEIARADVFIKAENMQHIGAFKARGALHAVGRLDPAIRARGVITYSSGNHAQAIALAAKEYGISADIAMPVDAPLMKVQGVRALGANIVFAGTTSTERRNAALAIRDRTGGTIIEPFDDADIIAGQGTATLELLQEVSARTNGQTLDALFVPVGGGGLLGGACLASAGTATRVFSVEPEGCDAMARSLEAGQRVDVQPGPTLADGLKPVRVGERNFAIAREHVAGCFRVNDDQIRRALWLLLFSAKILAEPSGAAALAAALQPSLAGHFRRIGVIISGGNVDPGVLADVLHWGVAQSGL
jgi:threo-3-hydroxy-L-aspartate ammonia-lyase